MGSRKLFAFASETKLNWLAIQPIASQLIFPIWGSAGSH